MGYPGKLRRVWVGLCVRTTAWTRELGLHQGADGTPIRNAIQAGAGRRHTTLHLK